MDMEAFRNAIVVSFVAIVIASNVAAYAIGWRHGYTQMNNNGDGWQSEAIWWRRRFRKLLEEDDKPEDPTAKS